MEPSCGASAVQAGLTVQVCFPAARAAVLDNLNRQREEGRLCDLSIQVQGEVFRAHRCVLAASSPYFHDQVLLKNVTMVSLPSVMDPVAFESVLSSAYTGQLSIVHDDIVNYVTVASFLQMWHIVDKCTEILRRSRPQAEAPPVEGTATAPGSASRQQSPSSTDCLYLEREGKRKERKADALPPLATWRRPHQFPRWGRPRAASGQHSADSQVDALASYSESDYPDCEETWVSSQARAGYLAHEAPSQVTRQHGVPSCSEAAKQKGRIPHRGGAQGADRLLEKSKDNGQVDCSPEKRRAEKREIEADEGVGEQAADRKEDFTPAGHCGFHPAVNEDEEVHHAMGGAELGVMKGKVLRGLVGHGASLDSSNIHACQKDAGDLVPTVPARVEWGDGPWLQGEGRPQQGEGGVCGKGEEHGEDDVDFECFPEGPFSRDTYDEIQDGTGQVSQRPLVPASPDFTIAGSEGSWPATGSLQGGSLTPTSSRHLSPSSAALPPPSSPPTPSSSSSVTLASAPYAGKVHFCHCGKAYTLKSMRDRHVKMQHLNLRPFGCPVCTKSFKMKHHLTKHLKTHGGLRPFECNFCGKKVIWRDSFLRHQARCQRLASSSAAPTANMDDSYAYSFEEGEAFIGIGGQVKVEEVDFQGEMEDRMGRLLGGVSGIVDELRTQSGNGDGHVYKEEDADGFGRT